MITVEYLPTSLDKVVDLESCRKVTSSELVLYWHVFHNLCLKLGAPTADLFALRVSQQVAQYVVWKRNPYSIATDVMAIPGTRSLLRISPILSDRSYTKQNTTRPSAHSNNDNNTLLSYPQVLGMLIRRPVLIPSSTTLSVDTKGNPHPLVLNKALMLVAWQVSRKNYLSSEFLTKQISLSPSQEGKVLWEITNRPGRSGLAGVTHGKLTHFNALWIMFYSIMNSFYTEQ